VSAERDMQLRALTDAAYQEERLASGPMTSLNGPQAFNARIRYFLEYSQSLSLREEG